MKPLIIKVTLSTCEDCRHSKHSIHNGKVYCKHIDSVDWNNPSGLIIPSIIEREQNKSSIVPPNRKAISIPRWCPLRTGAKY